MLKINNPSVWEKLKTSTEPIVMYGTGNGADKVLDIFEEKGIKIDGVTASSSFVRKREFRGYAVMPLEYFEEEYESFTVIITFGTSIPEVMDNIYKISENHRVLVPVVPVIGTEVFDEEFSKKHNSDICKAYNLLADEKSKKIYENYINFLYGGEISLLKEMTTPEEESFSHILRLTGNETYIDIGAYKGDTVDTFLKYSGGAYNDIICAEPDSKTFEKLLSHCENLRNFNAYNVAVSNIDGIIGFSDLHGRQSKIGGDKTTPSVSLPTLCRNVIPSYIKIDSEGCENEILSSGKAILSEYKPKLNVAAYHKCSDIFTLPILIHESNPQYKIHLRHHPYIPAWDTLYYCV